MYTPDMPYRDLKKFGFNVMPIPRPTYYSSKTNESRLKYDGKTPYHKIPWHSFIEEPLTLTQLEKHFTAHPGDNLAILTGRSSSLIVLDLDKKSATPQEVDETRRQIQNLFTSPPPTVISGGGGVHFYLSYSPLKNIIGIPITFFLPDNKTDITLDLKSDGGYVIAPPSEHQSGRQYIWHPDAELSQHSLPLPRLPNDFLIRLEKQHKENKQHSWQTLKSIQGTRNHDAASLTGLLLIRFRPEEWENIAWPLLDSWNKTHVNPPLKDQELRAVFNSIAQTEFKKYDIK